MLKTVLVIVIAAHGIGHILFLVPQLGIADWGQSTRSWLLTGETPARLLGSALWILAITAFCAAAFGLWNEHTWWRSAAIIAAVISALALIVFAANPVTSPAFFAMAFNIIVLAALLVAHWPSAETIGA